MKDQLICLPGPYKSSVCSPPGAPPTPPPSCSSAQSPVRSMSIDEKIEGTKKPVYLPHSNGRKRMALEEISCELFASLFYQFENSYELLKTTRS